MIGRFFSTLIFLPCMLNAMESSSSLPILPQSAWQQVFNVCHNSPHIFHPELVKVITEYQKRILSCLLRLTHTCIVHRDWHAICKTSPDGELLATYDTQGKNEMQISDIQTGKLLCSLSNYHNKKALTAEWSPDGTHIAVGGIDGETSILDVKKGKKLIKLIHLQPEGAIHTIRWSSNGSLIATRAYEDKNVHVFNAKTGHRIHVLNHSHSVWGIAWNPDGTVLATCFNTPGAILSFFDAETGQLLNTFPSPDQAPHKSIEWSPDGTHIAICTLYGAHVFNAKTGDNTPVHDNHSGYGMNSAWNPDSRHIAIGYDSDHGQGTLIFDIRSATRIHNLKSDGWVKSVAWSPDGKYLAIALERHILIYDFQSGNLAATLPYSTPHCHNEPIVWSTNCSSLISHSNDRLRIFHWKEIQRITETLSFAHNELLLALALAARDTRENTLSSISQGAIARIHANEKHWKTWIELKEILPEKAVKCLGEYIVNDSGEEYDSCDGYDSAEEAP